MGTDKGQAVAATALVVAVTGGIASGKSALTARLHDLGAPVVDADVIAHAVVEPGTPGLAEVVAAFGDRMLAPDGRLDRATLRAAVFADADARRRLEAIIHPRVRAAIARSVAGWQTPYGVIAVPLLAENAAAYRWVDRVLVVDVPDATQRQRLLERGGIDPGLADAIIAAQASRAQRLAIADDIHDASGPLAALDGRAQALHRHYLGLAQAKSRGALAPPRIRAPTCAATSAPGG